MRGISVGAMAATAALVAASPAYAHTTELQGDISPTGSITVTWHGDPSRGCAAAGLCGYRGSVGLQPAEGSYDFSLAGGRRLRDSSSYLDTAPGSLTRVERVDGSDEGACTELPDLSLDLTTARAGVGRARFGFGGSSLTVGRCAGPDLQNVLDLLPRHGLSLSRLRKGPVSVDMSGRASFGEGRFSGLVRSTVRLRLARSRGEGTSYTTREPGPPRDRRPRVRIVHLHSVYRVERLAGSLSATFGGLADPPCAEFDSCGLSGSSRWALDTTRGTIAFDAYALAKRSDRGLHGAFAALRRGRGLVFGDGGATNALGTTTADVTRPGGTPCHDTARVASPGLDAYTRVRGRVGLELGGDAGISADGDLTRAGCPGPRDEDILRPDVVAEGSLPAAAFAQRSISAPLRLQQRFEGPGYTGSVRSDFTLELRRTSARARYSRVRGGV